MGLVCSSSTIFPQMTRGSRNVERLCEHITWCSMRNIQISINCEYCSLFILLFFVDNFDYLTLQSILFVRRNTYEHEEVFLEELANLGDSTFQFTYFDNRDVSRGFNIKEPAFQDSLFGDLRSLGADLIPYLGRDYPGITTPYSYDGLAGSVFPLHYEDLVLPSLNIKRSGNDHQNL